MRSTTVIHETTRAPASTSDAQHKVQPSSVLRRVGKWVVDSVSLYDLGIFRKIDRIRSIVREDFKVVRVGIKTFSSTFVIRFTANWSKAARSLVDHPIGLDSCPEDSCFEFSQWVLLNQLHGPSRTTKPPSPCLLQPAPVGRRAKRSQVPRSILELETMPPVGPSSGRCVIASYGCDPSCTGRTVSTSELQGSYDAELIYQFASLGKSSQICIPATLGNWIEFSWNSGYMGLRSNVYVRAPGGNTLMTALCWRPLPEAASSCSSWASERPPIAMPPALMKLFE